ncbi:MAG: class I SAM-dependent methyltransferase [Bacteroidota bacterium]
MIAPLSTFLTLCLKLQRRRVSDDETYRRLERACRLWPLPTKRQAAIDAVREQYASDETAFTMQDYGAGSKTSNGQQRVVAEVYKTAASRHGWALFLHGLVQAFGCRHVLELGTNLGIGALYLEEALPAEGTLTTLEGDPTLAKRAKRVLGKPSEVIVGAFDAELPAVVASRTYDWVFIDGHHEAGAALRYFEMLRPSLVPGALVVFDDIEPWARTVRPAWTTLCSTVSHRAAVDFVKFGVLITD